MTCDRCRRESDDMTIIESDHHPAVTAFHGKAICGACFVRLVEKWRESQKRAGARP